MFAPATEVGALFGTTVAVLLVDIVFGRWGLVLWLVTVRPNIKSRDSESSRSRTARRKTIEAVPDA